MSGIRLVESPTTRTNERLWRCASAWPIGRREKPSRLKSGSSGWCAGWCVDDAPTVLLETAQEACGCHSHVRTGISPSLTHALWKSLR